MAVWSERGKWRARCRQPDGKYRGRTFPTELEAMQWEAAMKQETAQELSAIKFNRGKKSVLDAAYLGAVKQERTVAAVMAECFDTDVLGNKQQTERLIRAGKRIGLDRLVHEITCTDIDKMQAQMKKEGYENSSIEVYLSSLSTIFSRAERLHWLAKVPLMPTAESRKKPEKQWLIIKDEWYEHLISICDVEKYRLACEFMWHTGCRVNEIILLRWDRVNWSMNTVQFVKTKGLRPRTLPMSEDVQRILLAFKKLSNPDYDTFSVFPGTYTDYRQAYNGLYHYLKMEGSTGAQKGKRYGKIHQVCDYFQLDDLSRSEWHACHSFRHTKCTRLAWLGAEATEIMYWAGHKNLTTSQDYLMLSERMTKRLLLLERGQTSRSEGMRGQLPA